MEFQNNINKILEIEQEFLALLLSGEDIFANFQELEKFKLSHNIIEKMIVIQKSILREDVSLIELNASLRYILETLIQTELLLKEPTYTYKLYYSIFHHQIDKGEKFIKRFKKDIELLDKYMKEETELTNKLLDEGETNIIEKVTQEIDSKFDLEFTIFGDDYKKWGFEYTKDLLNKNVLPKLEAKLKENQEAKLDKAKKLVKMEHVSQHFNFNRQHSRVFNELKDERSWKRKAKLVGLEDEYELIYDLTSAILHCTSYSLITSNYKEKEEFKVANILIYKYSKKILKNIEIYTYENIKTIKLG